jgi:hypothetical protein
MTKSDASELWLQYIYPYEGDHLPKANGPQYSNVLPKEYEDITTILYVKKGVEKPKFEKSPPQSEWPKESR